MITHHDSESYEATYDSCVVVNIRGSGYEVRNTLNVLFYSPFFLRLFKYESKALDCLYVKWLLKNNVFLKIIHSQVKNK